MRRFLLITMGTILILILIFAGYNGYLNIAVLHSFWPGSGQIRLIDTTDEAGLTSFVRPPIHQANPGYIEVMGGGVAVGDIDGDGWEDIFFTSMPSFEPASMVTPSPSTLFRNRGDGTFEDITTEASLDGIKGYPMGALFFDFDNNGLQDLYIAAYDGGQLFRNGGGTFTDVTESAGLNLEGLCGNLPCLTATAATADYNRSGYLDLLIVNNVNWDIHNANHYGPTALTPVYFSSQPSILFRNNGNGTFTNVTDESGVTNQDVQGHREGGKGLSAVWADYNNDGWPDIYIANDMSPNRLYINRKNGTFSEIGSSAYVNELKSSMGVDAADFNYSGNMDLVVTNLAGSMTTLFQNYGNLRFDFATFSAGISPTARSSGWGIVFSDLDLDGHQDLVMGSGPLWEDKPEAENLFFKNTENGSFQDITEEVAQFSNDASTRGVAIIDIDRSGTPDLIFSNIDGEPSQLIKNLSSGNNWVRIDLEGVVSNRDAVGARVTLEREDGLVQNQTVIAGNSYISSGSKSLFFGLGNSEIKDLTIQWPSGRTETLDNPGINRILYFREGEGLVSFQQ